MKFKHPLLEGTSSTILKLATQLVAKTVRPGESLASVQRKVERIVKFLEQKSGIMEVDAPPARIGVEITPEDEKLFAPQLDSGHHKRRKKIKPRRVVQMKGR